MYCHSFCDNYLKFRIELDKQNKKRRQEHQGYESPYYREGWGFRRKK